MLQMLKGGSNAKCNQKKKSTKSNFLYDEKDMIKGLTDAGYYDEFKQLKAKINNKYSATHVIVVEDNNGVIVGVTMMPRSEYNKLAHASKDWEDSNVVIYDKTGIVASAKSIMIGDVVKLNNTHRGYEKGTEIKILDFKGSGMFRVEYPDKKTDVIGQSSFTKSSSKSTAGVSVGDTVTTDLDKNSVLYGKSGVVVSIDNGMAQVDFGNGDKYGISLERIANNVIIASVKSTASVAFVDYAKLRYSISISEGKFSTIAFENGEKVVCSNNILFLGISDHLKLDINNQISEGEIKQLIEKSEPVMVNADSKSYDLGGGNTLESVGFDTNGNWCYWVKLPKLRQRAIKVQIEANWDKISKSDLRNGVIKEKGLSELQEYLTTHYKAKFDTVVACNEDEDCSADSIVADLQKTRSTAENRGYQVIHNTYSSAVKEALWYAKNQDLEVSEDDIFNQITTGNPKPKDGETNRFSLAVSKIGKVLSKGLQVQITGVGNKYELNLYLL